MKLYYAPGTCAVACWIALEWAGAQFEPVKVDYASAEFKRVNPLAMVPALDLGGPRAMTQAGAILHYVAERFPAAGLGPDDDLDGRFAFNETMSFITGDLHPAFWPWFTPRRYTTRADADSVAAAKEAALARVDRAMTHLDGLVGRTGHLYRDRRTVADPYAFVMARWTRGMPKTFADYPNVARLVEKMQGDPAVARVLTAAR